MIRVTTLVATMLATPAQALSIPEELTQDFMLLDTHAKCEIYAVHLGDTEAKRAHLLRAVGYARTVLDHYRENADASMGEEGDAEIAWMTENGLDEVYVGLLLGKGSAKINEDFDPALSAAEIEAKARRLYAESDCAGLL